MKCFLSVAKSGSCRPKQRYRTRLLLEPLEDRCVPATITPTAFADGGLGSGSLRDAVLQFNVDIGTADDTIQLLPGTYSLTIRNVGNRHETAGLTGDLNLTQTSHRWIIQGAGPSTIIDASQLQDRVFQIVNPGTQVVLQDLVIQGGLAQDNGSDGAVAGTTDALGGGVLNNGGDVILNHLVVQSNMARGGDAAAPLAPGHNASGGAIYSTDGTLTIAEADIANNQATGGRGNDASVFPPYYYYPGADGGEAIGGGLYVSGGSLDISTSRIANNRATGGRAGDGASYTMYSLTYTVRGGGGGSGTGGGLYVNGGSLTLSSSAIASNQVTGAPAGLHGYQYGSGFGGGLYNAGTLMVNNCTLASNSTGSTDYNMGDGGGIYNGGTLTVSNSTLSGNSASTGSGLGGGIANLDGTLTVSNSTLSPNTAFGGGGIENGRFGASRPLTLTNVTLTANRATNGGGLYVYPGAVPVLHNTLIAGNFRGVTGATRDDVAGALNTGGDYNLIGDGTGMTGVQNGVNGNQVGSAAAPIDPLLGPLQDNGGPTLTHALLAGSPALNAGDSDQLGVADQRGVIRTGGVNVGAYQASASAFVVTVSGTVASGTPFDVTVQAVDLFGQAAFGYRGTVTFSVTDPDPAVVLPADYTFTADDHGTHRFTGEFTLITPGVWTLTAADLANGLSRDVTVTVDP
jgi:hypothetical protein